MAPPAVLPPVHPSTPADDDSDSSLDDADALPAVGRVWEDGPRRSLGEILAASNRQKQMPPAPPAQRDSLTGKVSPGLANIWPATLQQVHDTLGATVHVPLMSGQPRRDGSSVILRFTGTFAVMARYLEKHRDSVQRVLSDVAGEEMFLQFEIDESAPATPPGPRAVQASGQAPQPAQRQAGGDNLTAAAPPPRDGVTLTPELRAQLEKDPLIRAIMEAFNGNIVKVEE